MEGSEPGYWQAFQDEPYYLEDNINPQILESGTWMPPQIDGPTPLDLDEGEDDNQILHPGMSVHNHGLMQGPNTQVTHEPTTQTPYHFDYIPSSHIPARDSRISGILTPASSSHSLRPQAESFQPTAIGQQHHNLYTSRQQHAALARRAYTSSPISAYGTPMSVDSGLMPMPMPQCTLQQPQLERPPTQRNHHELHYDRTLSEEQSQTSSYHTNAVPSANYHGWETGPNGLAPSQDIAGWNEGTYIPGPQLQANTLTAPPSGNPVSRPATASVAGSSRSHFCTGEGCTKGFDSKSDLDHHERYHGPRKHICTNCNKGFLFPKDLKRHVKTHKQERDLFCTEIDCQYHTKGFQRKDHLKRHMQNVHGVEGGS